jgi:ribose transport system permease protein
MSPTSTSPTGSVKDTPVEPAAPSRRRRVLLGSATDITAILLVIVALFAILDFDAFFTSANLINILINASLLIVMAVGATFVLITGGVDLSVGFAYR